MRLAIIGPHHQRWNDSVTEHCMLCYLSQDSKARTWKPFKGVILVSIHVACSYWPKVKVIGYKSNPSSVYVSECVPSIFGVGTLHRPLHFSPKLCRFTANPFLLCFLVIIRTPQEMNSVHQLVLLLILKVN